MTLMYVASRPAGTGREIWFRCFGTALYVLTILAVTDLASRTASAQDADLLERGKIIFMETAGDIGCKTCHGDDGTGILGPDIREMKIENIKGALRAVADMEFIELTDDEIEAVAAYVAFLGQQK